MSIDINVHHHHHFPPAPTDQRMDQVIALLHALKHNGDRTMATLAEALAADEAAEARIIGLLQSQAGQLTDLAAQLAAAIAAGGDPAVIQAVADQMMADASTMQAAADAAQPPTPTP